MSPDELWQREYDRWLAGRAKDNARVAWRKANEPGYREHLRALQARWRASHREYHNTYNRDWMRRYRASK